MAIICLKINGQTILTETGKTVLTVATENGLEIPTLCFHPDIEAKHHCGMCLVKINGSDNLKHACMTLVEAGMEITTESAEITETRTTNLNQILQKHLMECNDCVWFQRCKLLELTRKYAAKPNLQKTETDQVLQVGTIVFDQTKCIGCENCLSVCPTKFLELNAENKVSCSSDDHKDCINCGQCILHCPVGAIEGEGEFEELERIFQDKSKITVVQFAPSIRTSLGEEFGLPAGQIVTGQLVAGLKQLGFSHIFDTAAGADFTTIEEAGELIDRLTKNENLPAMTSRCPARVRFLEFNYPEFLPNLCTSRSPQIMLGGIVKNYWAPAYQLDPKNVFVVSIMPCVAKKFEIKRDELKIDGVPPVDMVLTTRELARLLKKNRLDLKTLPEELADDPLGSPSGAGVIYGSSGGVFESALRTACFKMTGKNLPSGAVAEIRGSGGIKVKELQIGAKKVKVCVVNGIKNVTQVLEELKVNPRLYDVVEVMACPGGCVAGGGQSLPTTQAIVRQRSKSLYTIDGAKTLKVAHENPEVNAVYQKSFVSPEIRKKILHTFFAARTKATINKLKDSKQTL